VTPHLGDDDIYRQARRLGCDGIVSKKIL